MGYHAAAVYRSQQERLIEIISYLYIEMILMDLPLAIFFKCSCGSATSC